MNAADRVEAFRRWAHDLAGRFLEGRASDYRYDDLVQEALVAIWRAAEKKPDASAVYFAQVGRFAMIALLDGKQPFGGDPKPGPRYRPSTTPLFSLDASGDERLVADPEDVTASRAIEAVEDEVAAAVRAALDALPERDRILARMVADGHAYKEIADRLGVSVNSARSRFYNTVRPQLREALALAI